MILRAVGNILVLLICLLVAATLGNRILGFPRFTFSQAELNIVSNGFAATVIAGIGIIVFRSLLRLRASRMRR